MTTNGGKVHPEDCLHEEDFRRLEVLVTKVFEKMDSFLSDMHGVMVKEAVRDEKILQLDKALDNAHRSIREVKEKLQTLGDWRQRFEGGIKVMLAIPVACSLLTTAIAVYKMLHG